MMGLGLESRQISGQKDAHPPQFLAAKSLGVRSSVEFWRAGVSDTRIVLGRSRLSLRAGTSPQQLSH
jgi:hypothetical protein